ncbi:hypothetical protein SEA_FREDDIEHG_62 [Microbacterium phage FreddieHg]|nr:hypothetical protein SEA_FREDDIEHG_62 [Microbacterium phage FreddieHg]
MNTNRTAEIAKAREVDTEVARLWSEFHKVNDQIRPIRNRIESAEKSMARYIRLDLQIRAAQVRDEIAADEKRIAAIREEAAPLKAAAIAYDKANYEGWNRFFLVQHIHNSQHCSSFRPTTRVGWLPNVSGLTEAEAVAEHGATLCTICFPSAPVELTTPKVDESVCPGSGKGYNREHLTGRERSYYGKAGFCSVCDIRQVVTQTGAIRKHKKPTN